MGIGVMMSPINVHYVPLLKGKMGEFGALWELSPEIRSSILPLIDVPRIKISGPKGAPVEPLEDHLDRVLKHFSKSWPEDHPVFVDFYDLDLGLRTSHGIHPFPYVFDRLRDENIDAIPVTGLDRIDNGNNDYNLEVASAISLDNRGVGIRLLYPTGDLDDPRATNDEIENLLHFLGVERTDAYLILDVRWIEESDRQRAARAVSTFINQAPNIADWKELILAGSSYPENLAKIKRNTVTCLARVEFSLWEQVVNDPNIIRSPTFGDYGVVHPDLPDLDPRIVRASAKIRYTLENEWLILKGHSLRKDPGFAQFHDLSRELVARPEFLGDGFSWGDGYISGCASREQRSGNLTTWVKVDTNHHLTFVSEQFSNPT